MAEDVAEDVILTWSVTNWITVVLMVAVGIAVLTVAAQGVQKLRRQKSAEA